MKLYDAPIRSRIRLMEDTYGPPGASYIPPKGSELYFHHVDGMYSYCTTDSGGVIHLPAWVEVEIIKDKP